VWSVTKTRQHAIARRHDAAVLRQSSVLFGAISACPVLTCDSAINIPYENAYSVV
jgi:hypothetical protein